MKLLMVGNTTSVETIIEKKIIWQNRSDKTYIILKSIFECFLLIDIKLYT